MRIIVCLLGGILFFQSCKSVEAYNVSVTEKKSVKDLHDDVDLAYRKLRKLHPRLYQYTTKDSLDLAFSNLKNDVTEPLSPYEFHQKLAPVVARIGQGHLSVSRPHEKLSKEKRKSLKGKRFEFHALAYEYANDSLFVKKVNNYDALLVGSRVLKVNGESTDKLLVNYKKLISSDGYNSTFHNRFLAQHFDKFYMRDKGFMDSIQVTFKKKDSTFSRFFRYVSKDSTYYPSTKKPLDELWEKKLTKAEKKHFKTLLKQKKKYNKIHGFNPAEDNYSRNFEFIGRDGTVAYMKIRSFTSGKFKPFYEMCFDSIKSKSTHYLIIDLRNNNGGSLKEIGELYSYLAQEPFVFINEAEVNSRIPILKTMISRGNPSLVNVVGSIFSPIIGFMDLIKIHKKEGKLYYRFKQSKLADPKQNSFNGKIYVIINGSSFSASSILSANLEANKRATFVGEETGGAYNGTVAGTYKIIQLPASKIRLRVGLMQIETPFSQEPDGYGVKPDVEIVPTLKDLEANKDMAIQWILDQIER